METPPDRGQAILSQIAEFVAQIERIDERIAADKSKLDEIRRRPPR